tara:strand:- start:1737 stop:3305 length:1569 start_codon:yes stop_codon:yes gene_type:complete
MEKLKEHIQSVVDIYKSGNLSKAELLAKQLINNNPKIVFLYNLLGLILAEQKKDDQAMKCYETGINIDPTYGMIYSNMGLLFYKEKTASNIKKAETFYKKAISLDARIPEPHNNLGNLYNYLDKINDAIDYYKKAIDINPKFSYAHHNLGSAYVAIGKFSEAKKHFRESIKLNPYFTVTHRSLSRITKYTKEDEHFIELKKIYKNVDINDSEKKIELGFALGKAYEDTKDFDQSFIHYNEANLLQRKKINFSLKLEKEEFKEIKNIYNKKLFEKYKYSGCSNNSPIFVIGMPRSCTTLVEQILSSHKEVYGAEEVEFIPSLLKKNFGDKNPRLFFEGIINFDKDNLKKIGEEYIVKMRSISNDAKKTTDKLPINFLYIGFIKLILPNSKIVHCHRNVKDNCFSIFKNQFGSGKIKFAYDMNEIVAYYNLYENLMKYWTKLLPSFLYDIKYEDLISNTKIEIQKLLKYCNLNWSDDCLNFHNNKRLIKSASDIQVRRKIYSSSIDSWKNYEKYLSEYFTKLND